MRRTRYHGIGVPASGFTDLDEGVSTNATAAESLGDFQASWTGRGATPPPQKRRLSSVEAHSDRRMLRSQCLVEVALVNSSSSRWIRPG
jgi:hypothetical protein